MLMSMTRIDSACAALSEATAIVQAEWIRLRRPVMEDADHPCELPAARPFPRRTTTLAGTTPSRAGRCTRSRVARSRWLVVPIWARERSPPLHSKAFPQFEERR